MHTPDAASPPAASTCPCGPGCTCGPDGKCGPSGGCGRASAFGALATIATRALAIGFVACAIAIADSTRRPFSFLTRDMVATPASVPSSDALPAQSGSGSSSPSAGSASSAAMQGGPAPTATGTRPSPSSGGAHAGPIAGVTMIHLERVTELFGRASASGDVAFVDARTRPEFEAGHVPLAFHLPLDAFFGGSVPADLELIPKSFAVVVYCGGGDCDASIRVAERLRDFGYTDLMIFEDGFPAWERAGQPVERPGSAPATPAPTPARGAP